MPRRVKGKMPSKNSGTTGIRAKPASRTKSKSRKGRRLEVRISKEMEDTIIQLIKEKRNKHEIASVISLHFNISWSQAVCAVNRVFLAHMEELIEHTHY